MLGALAAAPPLTQAEAIRQATARSVRHRNRYTEPTVAELTGMLAGAEDQVRGAILRYKSLGLLTWPASSSPGPPQSIASRASTINGLLRGKCGTTRFLPMDARLASIFRKLWSGRLVAVLLLRAWAWSDGRAGSELRLVTASIYMATYRASQAQETHPRQYLRTKITRVQSELWPRSDNPYTRP